MAFRDGDEVVEFEGVVMIDRRDQEKQERSVLCRLPDGREKFVSRAQVPSDQEFPGYGGLFSLSVSQWLSDRWDEEGEPQPVKLLNAVVLRESKPRERAGDREAQGALFVRFDDGREEWCPKKGVHPDSPVLADGDRGELWVHGWCAKMKGWGEGESAAAERSGGGSVAEDARAGGIPDGDDIPF